MPASQFVDVRVLVDGQPLEEYPEPDQDTSDDNVHVRYVQAEAGQQFSVQVTWEVGFTCHWAPFLVDQVGIDDDPMWRFYHKDTKSLKKHRGVLTSPLMHTFSHIPIKGADGQWKKAFYEFGALGLDDTTHTSCLKPDQLQKLGSITVTVFRAREVPMAIPYTDNGVLPNVLDSIPEKLMKGQDVKTNTKYNLSAESSHVPQPRFFDYVPIQGGAGQKTTYIFKYRTKRALQNLGCIPRSPSPEPDQALIISRQDEMLHQLKSEVQALRRERGQKELGERNESRESSTTLVGNTPEPQPERGLKRERDDDDIEVVGSGPRKKKPAVIIDLIDDD